MVDIFPTLCKFADAEVNAGVQGKSLMPLLAKESGYTHRDAVFSENYFGHMVRADGYKLVNYTGQSYGELYDLATDPDEQNNLWDDPASKGIKTDLKLRLLDWLIETDDALPMPVRPYHFDNAPRDLVHSNGRAVEAENQHWYLRDMKSLYQDWEFHEDGILR